MKRRGEQGRPPIPGWLLSTQGRFLVDSAAWRRWCAESGWSKLDVLFEAGRRHRAAHGIPS